MITNNIISKWVCSYKDFYLAITEDKKVYDINTKEQLKKCYNNGTISYRYRGANKRIGKKTINKYCVKNKIVIKEYMPF